MVTGIEIAGLALAVAPLIISAIEHYREGLEPFKIWARYRRELGLLRDVLDMETAKLLNTCEQLLQSIVPQAELHELITHPGGPQWQDPILQDKLKELLAWSYTSFISALGEIKDTLDELHEKFDLKGIEGKSSDKNVWERGLDRLKFSLSAEKRQKVKTVLKDSNETLRVLTSSSISLAPSRSRRILQATTLETIRQNACGVHDVLESGPWGCTCPMPHKANLRLEARGVGDYLVSAHTQLSLPARFRFVFSFDAKPQTKALPPWNWHETDIEPLDDPGAQEGDMTGQVKSKTVGHALLRKPPTFPVTAQSTGSVLTSSVPPPTKKPRRTIQWKLDPEPPNQIPKQISTPIAALKQISALCATLKLVCEGMGCLGALIDQNKRRYAIHAVRRHPRALASQDIVCLKDFISAPPPMRGVAPPSLKLHLTRKERLQLALILASTMLQLHTTPWLSERWGKSDILFLRQLGGIRAPLIEQPYISKAFRSSKTLPSTCAILDKSSSASIIRNKSVFDLGVLLIELCFNKSLEQMQTPDDLDDDGKVNSYTSLATANRLIPKVYDEAGIRYGDAVRRCIRCDFDQREETFESDEFRQAVYQRVVVPLEDDLRDFCGGKIPQVS